MYKMIRYQLFANNIHFIYVHRSPCRDALECCRMPPPSGSLPNEAWLKITKKKFNFKCLPERHLSYSVGKENNVLGIEKHCYHPEGGKRDHEKHLWVTNKTLTNLSFAVFCSFTFTHLYDNPSSQVLRILHGNFQIRFFLSFPLYGLSEGSWPHFLEIPFFLSFQKKYCLSVFLLILLFLFLSILLLLSSLTIFPTCPLYFAVPQSSAQRSLFFSPDSFSP